MAGALLALFPVLLLFNTRLAWADLAIAIVVLCGKRLSAARPVARHRVDTDGSI